MIITICGSMQFHKAMLDAKVELEARGYTVFVPTGAYDQSRNEFYKKTDEEKILVKVEHDLIREHFHFIDQSDAILVLNFEKKGIPGYVGGNTFLEMGHAFSSGKTIYLLHPIPNMDYKTEMHAMKPKVINGDLSKINQVTK